MQAKFCRAGQCSAVWGPRCVITPSTGTQLTGKRFSSASARLINFDPPRLPPALVPTAVENYSKGIGQKETPFSLCYGVEAVIRWNRDQARLNIATYQQRVARYYNRKVKARQFEVGDLVPRSIEANRKECTEQTFSKWEGPFPVSRSLKRGLPQARNQEGRRFPDMERHAHRKYYQEESGRPKSTHARRS
ncbi:hypothetical protein Nepgr_021176 [Nepenthes gracilis]|uniref:Uncharacterized protein n=1 Tax=Nepenthes gracilis TaxID=150966 RepID=A0AAD3XWZ7_NEPGR|nr:hypothetical protein Nepgr_021176 [Nepenthes gracilis]